ncbi:hypothetical protein GGI21_003211, partial [Coemansia aciculifera]
MASSDNKLSLDAISKLFSNNTLFESFSNDPKIRAEIRLIKASAFIRSVPEWAEQLHDECKRQEWTVQIKELFKLADKDVEYIFEELGYYAQLNASSVDGEMLGAIEGVWIRGTSGNNCEIAEELKKNVAVLENDHANAL